jgi:hypothetical protein
MMDDAAVDEVDMMMILGTRRRQMRRTRMTMMSQWRLELYIFLTDFL